MEKKTKLIILIFAASLVVFISILYLNSTLVLEKKEIIATLIVGDKAGFDTNNTALIFGIITEGSTSSRSLTIENNYDFPIKVEFSASGNIKKFLVFEEVIYLDSLEEKTISISTINPVNEEYGNYSGKVNIYFKRNLWG